MKQFINFCLEDRWLIIILLSIILIGCDNNILNESTVPKGNAACTIDLSIYPKTPYSGLEKLQQEMCCNDGINECGDDLLRHRRGLK